MIKGYWALWEGCESISAERFRLPSVHQRKTRRSHIEDGHGILYGDYIRPLLKPLHRIHVFWAYQMLLSIARMTHMSYTTRSPYSTRVPCFSARAVLTMDPAERVHVPLPKLPLMSLDGVTAGDEEVQQIPLN